MLKQLNKKPRTTAQILEISDKLPFQYLEAYRSLRTNIQFASVDTVYRKIVVTSAVSGEGKSTVSVNLAITLGKMGCKVLLIDCDMREPMLDQYFGIENMSRGLSTILKNIVNADVCISYIEQAGIYLLPSGPIYPNPTEMIGSQRMADLVSLLSADYDYLIFDTPPASIVTDAAVLAKLADGVVFIVRQNYTVLEVAKEAIDSLRAVGANIIGSVLNDYNPKRSSKNFKYKGNYDYRAYP